MSERSEDSAPLDPSTRRSHRLSLRTRAASAVAGTALVLCVLLSALAYHGIRSSLLEERENSARRQADLNARALRTYLRAPDADPTASLEQLRVAPDGQAVLLVGDEAFSTSAGLDPRSLPEELVEGVRSGLAGTQRAEVLGTLMLVTGVPVVEADAAYFEVTSLAPVDDALAAIVTPMVVASALATLIGGGIGMAISGTVMRPVTTTSRLARRISRGDESARLDVGDDPTLVPLAESFNEMVDQLQTRIERESAFASNVSHELRAPVMALELAVDRVDRQRSVLPGEAARAVDLLDQQVRSFNQLVLDLLEISRFDAGTAELVTRRVDLARLVRAVLDERGDDVPVEQPSGPVEVELDPRRMHQVVSNLLENAALYAGGASRIVVDAEGDVARLAVEDRGPGVGHAERERIFQRFERGDAGTSLGSSTGTGLGLALVAHHVELHGGTIRVESPAGSPASTRTTETAAFAAASSDGSGEVAADVAGDGARPRAVDRSDRKTVADPADAPLRAPGARFVVELPRGRR